MKTVKIKLGDLHLKTEKKEMTIPIETLSKEDKKKFLGNVKKYS